MQTVARRRLFLTLVALLAWPASVNTAKLINLEQDAVATPVVTLREPNLIDPVLTWSTYLGGTGDEAEVPFLGVADVALDSDGNVYVTGTTASTDFPTTPGVDQSPGGNLDVFVTKLSPAGDVIYSTYLGGPCVDTARGIAVDASGSAYITGDTGGECYGQTGVLVAKLSPAGAVVYASQFGGTLADASSGHAIAVDGEGHAFVTGAAVSDSHDFPTTPGAYRRTECENVYPFAGDGFVAALEADGTDFVYSTVLCGGGDDSPAGIALDAAGNAYVAGTTASSDFPTVDAYQDTRGGGPVAITGFVSKLNPDGSDLLYSTYLGGSESEVITDVAVDDQGNAYVTGETASDDFPTTPGVLQEDAGPRHCIDTCTDAFVTKLAASGSALVYSTYLFGELDDSGASIAVDGEGNAYVAGATTSSLFPMADAFQAKNAGLADAFVVKLAPDGARLLRSSYLGGSKSGAGQSPQTGWDTGSAIAVDETGSAYVAGYTQSYDFPTTPDAFQPDLAAAICDFLGSPCGDVFVARIAAAGPGVLPPVWLTATPEEIAAGGTVSVEWAGLPAPGASDEFRLSPIGASASDPDAVIASWPTPGTAAGTVLLALPADIAAGWYELRLLSTNPDFFNLLGVMARSDALYVDVPTTTTSTTSTLPPSTTLPTVTTTLPVSCAAACGDANNDGSVTASDALIALGAAVGFASCPECICDVNANQSVSASDVLSILRAAVGLPVALTCAVS